MQTIGSRTSDAGPVYGPAEAPPDLTDLLFEVEWCAELANKAHKLGGSKLTVISQLRATLEAIERALELL